MVRRIPNQVHKQAARLLRQGYIEKEPAWYQAVLEYPPMPLPARAAAQRLLEDNDTPSKKASCSSFAPHLRSAERTVLPVVYLEDEVRRQFFRDHPFEAFRERTLVEGGTIAPEHPIAGEKWTRLSQRGRNPTSEDAVRFAVNLYEHHEMPLTKAYAHSVTQFRSLRTEHQIATSTAVLEAEFYGAQFGPTEIQKNFDREQRFIDTWEAGNRIKRRSSEVENRWRAVLPRRPGQKKTVVFTGGQEYVQLWKEGVRPRFGRFLGMPRTEATEGTTPMLSQAQAPEKVSAANDFMGLQSQMAGIAATVKTQTS